MLLWWWCRRLLYCIQYFEAIDLAITGIANRFDQPGYIATVYSNLESLLVKAANSAELDQVVTFYEDFDKLLLEKCNYKFSASNNASSKVTLKNTQLSEYAFRRPVCIL